MSKEDEQQVEYGSDADGLTAEHRDFLRQRHGTAELDPVPSMDPADPLNWPIRKKLTNLVLVAFHAMMATFTAAAILCAFVDIAKDLDISVQKASYLTSLVIAVLGGAPLFWCPISNRFGRRPIFLLSLVCSLVCNIGCAVSHSYGTMGLCRALTGFFISPAASIGSAVVTEMFFKKDRGLYMGVWTTMVTLGVPVAPFIFGFVALRVGYRWIYWTLAITNGVQFILYLFLGPETRYIPGQQPPVESKKESISAQYFKFRRIDPTPLRAVDFIRPLFLVVRPCVAIPAAAYAMIFLWSSVMLTIEIPQLFPALFGFNTQQVGLQNVSIIIGTLLGEQVGGILSDKWMGRRRRRRGGGGKDAPQEYRLWLSYIGHALTICGLVVFLVQMDRATDKWNVTPDVGAAIAAAGNQVVTTVMITYAVDCYRAEAANIGVFITFVRQIWGFIGPFWFPQMLRNVGMARSVGIPIAMIIGVSVIPTMLLQWQGHRWRSREH